MAENMRFRYLDNIRSFVIILVIFMHSSVTYSGIGGWYYKEGLQENLNIIEMAIFGILQSFTQAWFMGILFFVSAFLASRSLNKRGTITFIKERLFRLGIPLLFYMLVIAPFIYFILLKKENITWSYLLNNYKDYLSSFTWVGSTGPLWFVEVLLLFCIIYALARPLFFKTGKARLNWLKTKSIVYIILLTGVIAFIIRLWFPIGSKILNLQFSFFSSYIMLFILGIITGEKNLFEYISDEKNIKWFKIVLFLGIPLWLIIMILGGALKGEMLIYGGLYWQSFAYAIWESFVAIGFSIGIISFFKKYIYADNEFTKLLAEKAFSIYVFHAPFLITISLLLKKWTIGPLIKSLAAASMTFIICLIFSIAIHKIKPVRILLK
ncbi:acyltransferase [Treponema primitia]|uniref:acyltransferase family protein n=1 Tax=Treponema primitia TaxID=88058 RepID=UPI003980CBA6